MARIPAMPFRWNGDAMIPLRKTSAELHLNRDAVYIMEPRESRSGNSHRHMFAWLNEAWKSMPERYTAAFPSPEHLRKRALVEGGYYDETIVDFESKDAAIKAATAFRALDEFAWIVVRGHIVVIRRARSQAESSMNNLEFQQSKNVVLEKVAQLLGIEPEQLERAGREGSA